MGASRFPGKPLKKILGIPMVGHVFYNTRLAKGLSQIYIATCDREIFDYAVSIGAQAIMTKDIYERPTERVIEAVEKIEASSGKKVDAVVMIQGDEPTVRPENIDQLAERLATDKINGVVNLINKVTEAKEYRERDIVKLFVNEAGLATWFWRLPNPVWEDKLADLPVFIQTGIIGFRRAQLFLYRDLKSSPLERAHSVDMFRFIENGEPVATLVAANRLYSVDTAEDLALAENFLKTEISARPYLPSNV